MFSKLSKGILRQSSMDCNICGQRSNRAMISVRRTAPSTLSHYRAASSTVDRQALANRQSRSSKIPAAHKPPKRRMEAASQPLRNVASITRGPILQCIAHTTAERYDLSALAGVLKSLGVRWDEVPEGDVDRAFAIGPWKGRGGAERLSGGKDIQSTKAFFKSPEVEWTESESGQMRDMGFGYGERGEIWVFNSGSFVTWGLTEEEGKAFLREVIRRGVEINPLAPHECEMEEVDFIVDPTAKTHIMGNLILLGQPPQLSTFHPSPSLASLLARYTLSLSLSRSSSLSVLEERLDRHILSVSILPRTLEKYGRQPLPRKEVIRKMGELMTLRMAANTSGGGLDDTPEFYWSEPQLESYFDSVASEFEIKERIEVFNRKLDYAQEVQTTLRALLTESSAHRMEIIIILLISVEVIIVLIREGSELIHKLIELFDLSQEEVDELEGKVSEVIERLPPVAILPSISTRSQSDSTLWSDRSKRYV
nr:cytoplasmic protein [Cryptococcus depauperatus CBS 7855]